MISFNRIGALLLRHYYLHRESPSRVINMVVWVIVDIILWGFITRYLTQVTEGASFVPMLLGAVLLWDFLVRIMQGVSMAFFEENWSRSFLTVFASPITIVEYVISIVLTGIATSLVGLAAMLALATGIFGLSFFAYGMMLLPYLLILFLTGVALGIFGSSLVLRYGPTAEWFIWPIPALLSPFAAVFYPLSVLPGWMQAVAQFLPPSYVFESMRGTMEHGLAYGILIALLYIIIACIFFIRTFKRAIRTGLIARYGAETPSW